MPLTESDIVFYYTNNATQATNTLSLGGSISSTTITSGIANNIFDNVTGDESELGDTEYRAIAVKDNSSSYDMINAKVWITGYSRAGTGADTISFALEKPSGTTIQLIDNESTAPNPSKFTVATGATVSWTVEGSPSNTLFYGTLTAGQWFGIWLRREVPAGASAFNNRSCTLRIQCETTASPIVSYVIKDYEIGWWNNVFTIKKLSEKLIPKDSRNIW